MPTSNQETLFIIFIAFTGLAVSLQAGVLLALFLTVRKALASARERTEGFEGKIFPLVQTMHQFLTSGQEVVESIRALVTKLDPPLQSAAAELDAMTKDLHVQALRLQASVDDVAFRAHRQAARVDGMTTSFLNGLDRVGGLVNQAVDAPIRQVSGVIAAIKAVVETLRAPSAPRRRRAPRPEPATTQRVHQTGDQDIFV
ncbi:MAG TPA: hypothetical protein VFD98_06725 [Terracidiphilus sp.]|jgi:uncharacterized protein with PIN domain|nr:hypothetical protein [Terracidiphilus sp.]